MQDMQLVSQGNGQGVPPLNAMSASFSTIGLPSSVQSYPAQQHQQPNQMMQQPRMLGNHQHPHIQGINHSSPQQQAYAMRLAKERQLQQRIIPQSQQPYSATNALSPVQSSSQIQQQSQPSSCANPTPTQGQHNKQQLPRNPQSSGGIPNQLVKQRLRQQSQQQQPRHQLQQKQLLQQAKLVKGLAGRTAMMHQNLAVDPPQVSGMPGASRNQVTDKHLAQQSQGFFPGGSGSNSPLPQPSNHQKNYPRPPQSSKQMPPLPSHSDISNQSPLPVSSNHTLVAPQQPQVPSISLAAPSPPQQQRQINQNMQRMMLQQNRQLSSDGRAQSSTDQVNQIIPAATLPRCGDSSSSVPLVSSSLQWKPEPSYDTVSSTPGLSSSPSGNLVGKDKLVLSSSEGSTQRHISASLSVEGQGVGGQWQPQQQPQSQLQPQQQQQPLHSHCQEVQATSFTRPSHPGPG